MTNTELTKRPVIQVFMGEWDYVVGTNNGSLRFARHCYLDDAINGRYLAHYQELFPELDFRVANYQP